jgi:hypothetical protein
LFALRRGSSSSDFSGVRTKVEMENNPIDIDKLYVLEKTILEEIMVGSITHVELEMRASRGSHSPLARS